MNENALDMLKGMLGDNADEKIKSALGALSSGTQDTVITESAPKTDSLQSMDAPTAESIMQIKNMIDSFTSSGNDSRSNLLMSLRPYLRASRQSSVDTAIKLLNISKLSGLFKMR